MTKYETIYYPSPIGILEIKGTVEVVKSILFLDNEDMPISNDFKQVPTVLKECYSQLDEYFNGKRREFTIPYGVEGTHFQKTVWAALSTIPYGKVHSYKELALLVGKENGSRAVGNANRLNKLSIVIPCHRIIGSNRQLTGYAGGLWRKQWLLQHEKAIEL